MLIPSTILALTQFIHAGLPVDTELITVADAAQASTAVNGDLTAAIGSGAVVIGDRQNGEFVVTWEIYYEDLTGPIQSVHIHGPASRGENAGVLIDMLANGSDSGSLLEGFFVTTDADLLNALRSGNTYVNLHTASNGGGEIRGQIERPTSFFLEATLSPEQETDPVDAPDAQGTGFLMFDAGSETLTWSVTYAGLTGAPIGAHVHAPADFGANAGVAVDLGGGGLASPIAGNTTDFELGDIAHMQAQLSYFNVHTGAHQSGEIRGQLRRVILDDGFELPPDE